MNHDDQSTQLGQLQLATSSLRGVDNQCDGRQEEDRVADANDGKTLADNWSLDEGVPSVGERRAASQSKFMTKVPPASLRPPQNGCVHGKIDGQNRGDCAPVPGAGCKQNSRSG